METISSWGAVIALSVSIILILKKWPPAYSLIFGAFIGGFVSCWNAELVVGGMASGAKDITPAILRVLTAGVLAGVLIGTKSADKIALTVSSILGERRAVYAFALATFVLTFSGVFIDVAVLTVAPIALAAAANGNISKTALLVALIGGGKSGNVISPNPNTISAAANFDAPLSSVMFSNIGAALFGLIATALVVAVIMRFELGKQNSVSIVSEPSKAVDLSELPNIFAALSGPIVAIGLLILRPVFGIVIDPMLALPAGGLACALFTLKARNFFTDSAFGLSKMAPIAVLLLGTGCLGGIIKISTLKDSVLAFLSHAGIADIFIASVSGALMSSASASTTAGAAIASATFSQAVLASGVSAVWGAAMTNAGAVVLDHMPHGSFFHVSGGAVGMGFGERMKIIPYETLIGGAIAFASTFSCWLFL